MSRNVQIAAARGLTQSTRTPLSDPVLRIIYSRQDALIFRLQTELLQLIFEIAVKTDFAGMRIPRAVELSQVCRRWRAIAIDTPTLWATLAVPSLPEVFSGDYLSVRIAMPRIKAAPATVAISNIYVSHLLHNPPERWPFFQLANLWDLSVHFNEPAGLQKFGNATLNALRYRPLRRLSLSVLKQRQSQPFVELGDIFILFPNLTHLTLSAVQIPEIEGPLSTSLVYCDLRKTSVNLPTIYSAFPDLELLQLVFTPLRGSTRPLSAQTVPALRRLTIKETDFFEDSYLFFTSYPNLTYLYNSSSSSQRLIQFLRRHLSVEHLDCFLTDQHVVECAKVAPQLTHICLTSTIDPFVRWKKHGLDKPPFPHLETLLLADCLDPFTNAEFESLVKARFLPVGHPQSLLRDKSLHVKELRIIRKNWVDWESEDWADHSLCWEAKIKVAPYEEKNNSYYISLRWI